jgi:hypothetical protein
MLVQPRILARTVNIERGIVRVADDRARVEAVPATKASTGKQRASNLTEEEFYERLSEVGPELPDRLQNFLSRLQDMGITWEFRRSLIIRWRAPDGTGVNLAEVSPDDGQVSTSMIHHHGGLIGADDLTEAYVQELAQAIQGELREISNWGRHRVVDKSGKPVSIVRCLDAEDQWIAAIERFTTNVMSRMEADN